LLFLSIDILVIIWQVSISHYQFGLAMYQDFFSLQQHPFSVAPDPDYLFFTEQHKEALAHLTYGLQGNGGFVVLTGEVGTGKTSICQFLLQALPENTDIASITHPAVSEIALLVDICDQFLIEYDRNNITLKVMFDALASWMIVNQQRGRHAIVLIDEAQHLSFNGLEQLRLITNIESDNLKPLQIILIGQTALQEKLLTNELRQLSQRITARYHLSPLNKQECDFYIHHRLNKAGAKTPIFSAKSIALIFKASQGIPKHINQICDRCLLSAYTQSLVTISPSITKQAIHETELPTQKSPLKTYLPYGVALIAILLTALTITAQQSATYHTEHETSQKNTPQWLAMINEADALTHQSQGSIITPVEVLSALPARHFTLQIAVFNDLSSLQQFFENYPLLQENSYRYQSHRTDKTNYIMLLGNFESYKMAKLVSQALTKDFPTLDPWIKDYRTIQQDL